MTTKAATATAVFLSAVALAACGGGKSQQGEGLIDHGSRNIPECPDNYYVTQTLKDKGETPKTVSGKINSAVSALAASLPRNVRGEPLTTFNGDINGHRVLDSPQKVRRHWAAELIFYKKYAPGIPRKEYILGEDPQGDHLETKIDDFSEEFCTTESGIHLSMIASSSIIDLEQAGVHGKVLQGLDGLEGRWVSLDQEIPGN